MGERLWIHRAKACATFVAAMALCLGSAAPSHARPASAPAAFMADVRSFLATSLQTGRVYQISVALPDGYSRRHAPYPVLYALDANAEFGTVVETARLLAFGGEIPGVVVVGIGYPKPGQGFRAANVGRTLDLTPTSDPEWIRTSAKDSMPQPVPVPDRSGGGPRFLRFLETRLVPLIERRYNVSHDDRALAGHSFGGLFAAYALLQGDGAFRRFLIGSPSLWWDHQAMLGMEEAYAASGRALNARVFLSSGALEDGTGGHPMTSDFKAFVDRLKARNYRGLEFGTHVFEGEDHGSVLGATVSRGLRFIYAPAPAPASTRGLGAAGRRAGGAKTARPGAPSLTGRPRAAP